MEFSGNHFQTSAPIVDYDLLDKVYVTRDKLKSIMKLIPYSKDISETDRNLFREEVEKLIDLIDSRLAQLLKVIQAIDEGTLKYTDQNPNFTVEKSDGTKIPNEVTEDISNTLPTTDIVFPGGYMDLYDENGFFRKEILSKFLDRYVSNVNYAIDFSERALHHYYDVFLTQFDYETLKNTPLVASPYYTELVHNYDKMKTETASVGFNWSNIEFRADMFTSNNDLKQGIEIVKIDNKKGISKASLTKSNSIHEILMYHPNYGGMMIQTTGRSNSYKRSSKDGKPSFPFLIKGNYCFMGQYSEARGYFAAGNPINGSYEQFFPFTLDAFYNPLPHPETISKYSKLDLSKGKEKTIYIGVSTLEYSKQIQPIPAYARRVDNSKNTASITNDYILKPNLSDVLISSREMLKTSVSNTDPIKYSQTLDAYISDPHGTTINRKPKLSRKVFSQEWDTIKASQFILSLIGGLDNQTQPIIKSTLYANVFRPSLFYGSIALTLDKYRNIPILLDDESGSLTKQKTPNIYNPITIYTSSHIIDISSRKKLVLPYTKLYYNEFCSINALQGDFSANLGLYSDVINISKRVSKNGSGSPNLLISSEFLSVLEGSLKTFCGYYGKDDQLSEKQVFNLMQLDFDYEPSENDNFIFIPWKDYPYIKQEFIPTVFKGTTQGREYLLNV